MSAVKEFGDILEEKFKGNRHGVLLWAKVESVDWDNRVCDVVSVSDGLEIFDVRTGLGMMQIKPTIGSLCLVGYLEKSKADAFLLFADEVDEVLFMSDDFGGWVNAKELKTQVDKNTSALNALQKMFQNFAPVPSDGGAKLKADALLQFVPKPLADLSNIQSEKYKHG